MRVHFLCYIFRWVSLCMWGRENGNGIYERYLLWFITFFKVLFIVPCIEQYKPLFFSVLWWSPVVFNVQMVSHGIHGNQIRWWRIKWEPSKNTYSDGMALRLGSVNTLRPSATFIHQHNNPKFIQIMACHLFRVKLLPALIMDYCHLGHWEQIPVIFE